MDSDQLTLRELDSSRHNPVVGVNYGKTSLGRMLVVGMSHYGDKEDVCEPGATLTVVTKVLSGEWKKSYFRKIAELFPDQNGSPLGIREFYSAVAFYNFLPDPYERRQLVTLEQWQSPDTSEFFFEVLDALTPDRVLLTGVNLWRFLPSRRPSNPSVPTVHDTDLPLPFDCEGDGRCCLYETSESKYTLIGAIPHPSWPTFASKRRKIKSEWIPKFMKYAVSPSSASPGDKAPEREGQ